MLNQPKIIALRQSLENTIVGQSALLDRLVIGLLTGGHLLLEGLPGLAKTTAVKALAGAVHARFQRIQFTPDLLPGDLTGTDIYNPQEVSFCFVEGPLFHEIILADEINRAPAKVQSALLEAMQEHQITVGGVTRPLPPLFMVLATQNPLEQAGTYPLPEAQLDRFLLHVELTYPSAEDELRILQRDRMGNAADTESLPKVDVQTVLAAREEVRKIHLDAALERYIVTLVGATRDIAHWLPDQAGMIEVGASPRASLAIAHAACGHAYLQGREYVIPDDIHAVAADCLRHRIIPSFNARMEKVSRNSLLQALLDAVPVP
ncbi:MoxR-like ATPase in aerotolerance operon [Sulfuriferula multivorans]|uniref:MoxR-like ATPase in aerotolerance operon n=1 Tax=Sulfuriferula multivorans TaxID=1559896 RepID=A0A401JEM8_9PROT|nr:MoxR-like ATPase in aerotolerance operon [Sulfuriferula multivorans]